MAHGPKGAQEEFTAYLNRLAGTTGLPPTAAANALAGTSGLALVGALNAEAGTSGLGYGAALAALELAGEVAFSPSTLTNLYSWYKGDGTLWLDSARTTPASGGGLVGSWDDASGNGYHCIQAADVAKPTLEAAGGPNSTPCVTNTNGYLNAASLPGWTGGVTIFLVAKASGGTPSSHWWMAFKADDTQSIIAGFEASGMLEWFNTPRTNIGTSDATNWAVYELVDMGTGAANSIIGLKNGTVTEQAVGSSKTFSTMLRLFHSPGAAFGSPAKFAEVIVYKEGKGTTDRASVRSYLGTKYGITVS